jgi:hypothetical protein
MHIFTAGEAFGVVQRHFELFSLGTTFAMHLFALKRPQPLKAAKQLWAERSLRLCVSKVLIIVVHYHAAEICWLVCAEWERKPLAVCAGARRMQWEKAERQHLCICFCAARWADDDKEWPPTYFLCHQQASEGQPGSICCASDTIPAAAVAGWNVCCVTQQQST